MKFYRNIRGYYFRNWCVTLTYFDRDKEYSIQMRIPGIKGGAGFWTIYKAHKKPRFRKLSVFAALFPLHFLKWFARASIRIASAVVGAAIYMTAKLLKAVAYLFLFAPYSAKQEVKGIFTIWYKDPRDIL